MDRYTKIVLTIIAVNLTLMTVDEAVKRAVPDAWARTVTGRRIEKSGRFMLNLFA